MNNLVKKLLGFGIGSFIGGLPLAEITPLSYPDYVVCPKATVVLDPGHGGKDKGHVAKDGTYESDLNLSVVLKLKNVLQDKGYWVLSTRENDSCVNTDSIDFNNDGKINHEDELMARADFSKENKADYFLSIHCNSNDDSSLSGPQVFFYGLASKKHENNDKLDYEKIHNCKYFSQSSLDFASELGDVFKKNNLNTVVWGGDFTVLYGNPAEKSVLWEVEQMTNKEGLEFVKTEEGQNYYVKMVADAFE
ncbi:N-acetylmuramoyl-L-alanine amidase [archaeon]|jgi:N-acetylmuramoyl-L-alanine amidase|nr:N-acetylmuramoyl-L-alanine amidase [archaeon]